MASPKIDRTEPRVGLEGVRVLEVAGGVGVAYAAKLFADLGADVVRLEPAGDAAAGDVTDDGSGDRAPIVDVVRRRPHGVHRWLNTNKRSIVGRVEEFSATADIVLHDLGPARAAAAGLEFDRLMADNATLVVCAITPFGPSGPYADFAAEEITVIHGSSWGFLSPSAATRVDLPPLKAPGHHATINAATTAATVALAAFDAAQRTGIGSSVDFSVFAAAAKMTETAPVSASYLGVDASRLGVKMVVPWNIYRCRDGLVQFICPEEWQWQAFVKLIGCPDWATLEAFASGAARQANSDLVDVYVGEWMAQQTVDDLCRAAHAARICITPMNTLAKLDADPHFRERGFFAQTPDGLRLPGPGFRIDRQWWALRRSAPNKGQHAGEGWRARSNGEGPGRRPAPVDPDATSRQARPLDGVRVCDFTWIWAGPYCTQTLAHLGADVIKLESVDRLCMFRRLPYSPTGVPLDHDTAGVFHLYNSDKRSVGIDLGQSSSRQIVERLVAVSDVVVDNFGVGTMARLGFGPDDLRRINPNVIVASLSGYGQTGPAASYMAYGPAGGAISGLYAANGYEGGMPAETGISIGDPGTGIAAAWAVMAALTARRRNGEVATVDVAMVEAVAATIGELWMEWQVTGRLPGPRGNHDPIWSPHNCYPAAGRDHWVTIACPTEWSWRRLCEVVDPALDGDPRFASAADRKRHEPALDELIGAWTARRDRWEVTRLLQGVGGAAFPSLSPLELWGGDRQLAAIGMIEQPDHGAVGRRTVPGVPWRLSNGANGLQRPAPLLGQHSREVLADVLGYSDEEIQQFLDAGVITEPAPA